MSAMNHVILVFVDGLGLGEADADDNPLNHSELNLLANFLPPGWAPPPKGGRPPALPEVLRRRPLPYEGRVRATDASLGMPDLPQSATGQATILTGENAALLLGRHLYGYPSPTLQRLLMRSSIFKILTARGVSACFANAFRPLFFELGDAVWSKRMSATTWANRAGGLPFKTVEDLQTGRAVYQDITHDSLRARGVDIAPRPPEEAGRVLAALADDHAFTLFEFFQTDKAGHARDRDKAAAELLKLEAFMNALLAAVDLTRTVVVLTSDHGNIEDLSTKSHTLNPVPTLTFGGAPDDPLHAVERLEQVTPAILRAWPAAPSADP